MHGLAGWLFLESRQVSIELAFFYFAVLCAWAFICLAWRGRWAWDGFAPGVHMVGAYENERMHFSKFVSSRNTNVPS